jgi:hypothetical protein
MKPSTPTEVEKGPCGQYPSLKHRLSAIPRSAPQRMRTTTHCCNELAVPSKIGRQCYKAGGGANRPRGGT